MTSVAHLSERVEVQTCIACGARSRPANCAEGCADQPLDLVEAADVDAVRARRAAVEQRADQLRRIISQFVADPEADWDTLRASGRATLARPLPSAVREARPVAAWGCPSCGRVEAPQPCLDVCIRRPVLMADLAEYRAAAEALAVAESRERTLADAVRLIVHVRPRTGHQAETLEAVRQRCAPLATRTGGDRRPFGPPAA